MKRRKIQQYRMLTRVVDFGAKYVGLFPENTMAGELLVEIGATVTTLTEHATSRVSSQTSILMSGGARRKARLVVKRQMESAAQIARALKLKNFSIPQKMKEEDLISTARSFVERMEPLKTEFSQHGLPPEKLKTSIQALEESLLQRAKGQSMRSGAIREFNKLLDEALNLVERFEAIIDNTLADDELVNAAWKVARGIDRPPRSSKAEPEPETQATVNKPEPEPRPKAEPKPEPKAEPEPKPQPEALANQSATPAGEEAAIATA